VSDALPPPTTDFFEAGFPLGTLSIPAGGFVVTAFVIGSPPPYPFFRCEVLLRCPFQRAEPIHHPFFLKFFVALSGLPTGYNHHHFFFFFFFFFFLFFCTGILDFFDMEILVAVRGLSRTPERRRSQNRTTVSW